MCTVQWHEDGSELETAIMNDTALWVIEVSLMLSGVIINRITICIEHSGGMYSNH
jgi:hypothetical protein